MSKKDQFVPEAWHGGTQRTDVATLSDNLVVGKEQYIGAMKSDRRHLPVTYKTVDRSRDLRSCFSYSK
jgi:hypothetical protein